MLVSTLLAAFAVGCAAALPSVAPNDAGDSLNDAAAPHNLTFRDIDTRFTVPNALIDWYADNSKPYENRATWFPSAKVRTDLWIFQPSGAQMRNSVLLQSNLASSETQMSGRWDLPVGYNYQLVLTVAGDKDPGQDQQETHSREWGTVWGNPSGANATASYSAQVAIESGNGTSPAVGGQKPVVFGYPSAKDTWVAHSAGNSASWAPAVGVPTDLWLKPWNWASSAPDPVLVASGINATAARANAGASPLPVGKSFVLVLTRAGEQTSVLATSQAFEITAKATDPANMVAAGALDLAAPAAAAALVAACVVAAA
ncbi:uncharacterized protein LOC62_07G009148 [Vanrija pseudolonga]|uniref:Uncharacterized protein n=1 Tax=Vanrija pseudolonga TaxID=143232 RepID=A0AAF0YJH2_9TREE|nr:hypothetical protein LOC62_07G009148 [Vanrija pseudolonga]